jgi:hypothetical protein
MPFDNLRVIGNAIELILGFGDAKATLYFLTVSLRLSFFGRRSQKLRILQFFEG